MLKTIILINRAMAITLLLPFTVWAQTDSTVIHLWKNGAPGFEKRANEPEKGPKYISNIHNPSITVFLPPKEKAIGAAMVICPGGGHRMLVINSEGYEAAHYLNSLGIAAIVLKYRLARDTMSPYQVEVHAPQDAARAIRLTRSYASQWGIDSNRVGLMGFSAGGEVVDMVTYGTGKNTYKPVDATDKLSAKPNFVVLVYPGPLGVPDKIAGNAPPAFLIAANEDVCCSPPIVKLLQAYRLAGVPVEAHIYAKGNHAFNMGKRSEFQSLKAWPQRLADWLADNNYFRPGTIAAQK